MKSANVGLPVAIAVVAFGLGLSVHFFLPDDTPDGVVGVPAAGNVTSEGLRAFEIVTRLDPLFYTVLPVGDFRAKELAQHSRRVFSGTSIGRYYDARGRIPPFYPLAFLSALDTCKTTGDAFLESPSATTAEAHVDACARAADAYRSDIGEFAALLNSVLSDGVQDIVLQAHLGQVAPLSLMLRDLRRINDNAQALIREVDRRRRLLYGFTAFEPSPPKSSARSSAMADMPVVTMSAERARTAYWTYCESDWLTESTDRHLLIDESRRAAYPFAPFGADMLPETTVRGPYYIPLTALGPDSPERPVYGVFADRPLPYPRHILADGMSYDIDRFGLPDNVLSACCSPYAGMDMMAWYRLDALMESIARADADMGGYVLEAENALRRRPSWHKATALAALYHEALIPLLTSPAGEKQEDTRRPMEQRLGILRSGLAFLPQATDDILTMRDPLELLRFCPQLATMAFEGSVPAFHEIAPEDRDEYIEVFYELPTFVLRYSHYTLFFAPWSDAVWRLEQPLECYAPPDAGYSALAQNVILPVESN